MHRGKFELLVERILIFEKQENYAVVFAIGAERLFESGYLEKVK